MAAVEPRPGGRVADPDSRAQIILVGGLALAVTLLALAVVLNSAIYTENLATRSREAAPAGVLGLQGDVEDGVGDVVEHVNRVHGGDDYGTLQSQYDGVLDDWRPMAARHAAVGGRSLSVTRTTEMEGTRILDADPSTAFTPRTSPSSVDALGGSYATPNWQVATDVRVRAFVLGDVALSSLAAASPGDPQGTGAFYVEVRDTADADVWRVAVYEDAGSGDLSVTTYDADAGSVVGTCSTGESTAEIDLTGATLNVQPCDALGFLDDVDGRTDVYFVAADQIQGTYEVTVDRAGHGTGGPLKDAVDAANYGSYQCGGPTYFDDPASGSPSATAGIYSATVGLRYDDPSLTYEAAVRTAPGEPGPGATAPVLTGLSVTDNSDGTDAIFDLSWTVADPNGDSVSVTVEVRDVTDASTATQTYTGAGSDTLTDAGDDGHTYEITVTVDDGTNSRSTSETHVADGDDNTADCPP